MATKRGKTLKKVTNGVCHIKATFNNTIITFTDEAGDVFAWSSTGEAGFKGTRRGTPFAAKTAAEKATKRAKEQGLRQVRIRINGAGNGRDSAVRAISAGGVKVTAIADITPIPHNGCKQPKMRRI